MLEWNLVHCVRDNILDQNKIGNMNSVRQPVKIAILAVITLALAVAAAAPGQSQPFSLYSATKTIFTNAPLPLTKGEIAINPVLPVIEMTNVPLSEGIQRLLRQSRMRATIDWHLADLWAMTDAKGNHIHEPMLNFRWTNMTASDALFRVLREHHLAFELNPLSLLWDITYTNDLIGSKDLGFFDPVTNAIPLIQFEDVPITVGLENLARAANFNYMFDPYIGYGYIGYGRTNWNGRIIREPLLTLKVTNRTAEHVFCAICVTHRLDVVPDPKTGVTLVRYKGHDVDFVDADCYGKDDTNTIPLIQLKDVPISTALKNLARQAGIKCMYSPRIDTGHPANEVCVNVRWQNITASQAFAAICESYDLDLTKYPVSGYIRVEPKR